MGVATAEHVEETDGVGEGVDLAFFVAIVLFVCYINLFTMLSIVINKNCVSFFSYSFYL